MPIETQRLTLPSGKPYSLIFENNAGQLTSTNYWDSPPAQVGAFYMTLNSSVFRLLVPRLQEHTIAEMRTGRSAYLEPSMLRDHLIDLVFDDLTTSPFSISLEPKVFDRNPYGRYKTTLAVYTASGKQLELSLDVRLK